jgi:hypothetical protein
VPGGACGRPVRQARKPPRSDPWQMGAAPIFVRGVPDPVSFCSKRPRSARGRFGEAARFCPFRHGGTGRVARSRDEGCPKSRFDRVGGGPLVHIHSALQPAKAGEAGPPARPNVNRRALLGLVDSLESTVRGLRWKPRVKGWANYYDDNTYTPDEFQHKARLVAEFLERTRYRTMWALGANTGYFSHLAAEMGLSTIAFDYDPACVERTYLEVKKRQETKLLPLVLDLFNPSPPSGWLNQERSSFFNRGNPDLVLALALVHHLAFTGNQPLENLADFLDRLAPWLVIEFVPETDPQSQLLLARRRGIHHPYDRARFEACFGKHFDLIISEPVSQRGRTLYLMRRRDEGQ